jgi:hypothetical protein
MIGKLYDIEKQIIDLNDADIYQTRQKESKPITILRTVLWRNYSVVAECVINTKYFFCF